MIRKNLKKYNGKRITVTATFERNGTKNGYKGLVETVLLTNIADEDGNQLCDHLWFTKGKQFKDLDLKNGDKIQLTGRVTLYEKGYFGRREDVYVPYSTDYKLSNPSKVRKI